MKKYLVMTGNILLYLLTYLWFQVSVGVAFIVADVVIDMGIKHHAMKNQDQIQDMVMQNIYVLTVIAAIVSLVIYYVLLMRKDKNLWQRCEFKKVEIKTFVLIPIVALSLSIITYAFLYATKDIFKDYSSVSEDMVKGMQTIFGMIAVVILVPIFEEILFRGLIFNELRKNINIVASIIIQAIIFGVVHGNLAQGIYAFVLGVVLAIIYTWTKSIISNITLHVCFNFFGTVGVSAIMDNTSKYMYIYLITAIIVIVGLIYVLYKNTHNKINLNLTNKSVF